MKIVLFGNSGSGKSTLARQLAREHGLSHLDLDSIVWEPGKVAVQRPLDLVRQILQQWVGAQSRWVVEGCYGELVRCVAPLCTEMIFLNPGLETCLANNRRRPWEPHKYASPDAQQAMLDRLQEWVAQYYVRGDTWSYAEHRRLFDSFDGTKTEMTG